MTVLLSNRQKAIPLQTGKIKKGMNLLLRALDCPGFEVSLLFTDDPTIRGLNRLYRKKDRATDVLSFSQREGEFSDLEPDVLGDIVISTDTVLRRTRLTRKGAEAELFSLLVHGLLHLLGYDHETTETERRRMRRKERELMGLIRKSGIL